MQLAALGEGQRTRTPVSPPSHAITLSWCPSLRYSLPRCSHSSPRLAGTRVRSREKWALQFETGERPATRKDVPNGAYKKEVPQRRLQRSAGGKPAPTTGTDSLTPRFRAVLGQPGHGACGRLANRVAPLSANQPIASRRRGKFECQLHAPRSALNNDAPNSNQPGLQPATGARGGACRREPRTRGVIAQETGRRSTSGSDPVPPTSASAMASSSGAGATAAAAATNLNAVRETMDGECPFHPLDLAFVC